MLTTEQVKKIAEYLYPLSNKWFGGLPDNEQFDAFFDSIGARNLNPEKDDADSMKVFSALVDECKKQRLRLNPVGGLCAWKVLRSGERKTIFFNDEFNNKSICLAYLAVMESK